jgi:hypothetical protein
MYNRSDYSTKWGDCQGILGDLEEIGRKDYLLTEGMKNADPLGRLFCSTGQEGITLGLDLF